MNYCFCNFFTIFNRHTTPQTQTTVDDRKIYEVFENVLHFISKCKMKKHAVEVSESIGSGMNLKYDKRPAIFKFR